MRKNKFKNWVNLEVEKKLDEGGFSSLPLKMRIGIFLLMTSFTVGYGFPILALIIAGYKHQLAAGLLRSSIVYSISWLVGAVGLSLAGKGCIKYPIFFLAKFIKKIFPGYFETGK